MYTNDLRGKSLAKEGSVEPTSLVPINGFDLSWPGLWNRLSRHADGSLRVVLDEAENMVMKLRRCDTSGLEPELAEILRDSLDQFCKDLTLFDSVQIDPKLSAAEERRLLQEWFRFRCSPHSWGDLDDVIQDVQLPQLLVPLMAEELRAQRNRYLNDLSEDKDPHTLVYARRVVRLFNESFPLLTSSTAALLPEVGEMLYRQSGIDIAEYVRCLCSYAKSSGVSIENCLSVALRAANFIPEQLDPLVQADLLNLGQLLGVAIEEIPRNAFGALLQLPDPTLIGIAPAMIAELGADSKTPASYKALCDITAQLIYSMDRLDPSLLEDSIVPLSSAMLSCLAQLSPETDLVLLKQIAPFIVRGDWFKREAQPLWDVLSSRRNPELAPLQSLLIRHILASSEATDSFCAWCYSQASLPFFQDRLKAIGALMTDFLRVRKDPRTSSISDMECLRALSVVSAIGAAATVTIPEIASLLGVPVIRLPFFGLVVIPLQARTDSCPDVIRACRYILKTLSPLCRPRFVEALRRRGV